MFHSFARSAMNSLVAGDQRLTAIREPGEMAAGPEPPAKLKAISSPAEAQHVFSILRASMRGGVGNLIGRRQNSPAGTPCWPAPKMPTGPSSQTSMIGTTAVT
jgi:hypothetical protein